MVSASFPPGESRDARHPWPGRPSEAGNVFILPLFDSMPPARLCPRAVNLADRRPLTSLWYPPIGDGHELGIGRLSPHLAGLGTRLQLSASADRAERSWQLKRRRPGRFHLTYTWLALLLPFADDSPRATQRAHSRPAFGCNHVLVVLREPRPEIDQITIGLVGAGFQFWGKKMGYSVVQRCILAASPWPLAPGGGRGPRDSLAVMRRNAVFPCQGTDLPYPPLNGNPDHARTQA